MNPGAPPPAQISSSSFSPSSSPLHPQSVAHNTRVLSSLATLAACFSGLTAGILGLTNLTGFAVYILTSALSALSIGMLKCAWNVGKFVPQAHLGGGSQPGGGSGGAGVSVGKGWFGLLGLGQENFLGFLLFWIGGYALIHVYD